MMKDRVFFGALIIIQLVCFSANTYSSTAITVEDDSQEKLQSISIKTFELTEDKRFLLTGFKWLIWYDDWKNSDSLFGDKEARKKEKKQWMMDWIDLASRVNKNIELLKTTDHDTVSTKLIEVVGKNKLTKLEKIDLVTQCLPFTAYFGLPDYKKEYPVKFDGPNKDKVIEGIASIMGLTPPEYNTIKDTYEDNLKKISSKGSIWWYVTFGVIGLTAILLSLTGIGAIVAGLIGGATWLQGIAAIGGFVGAAWGAKVAAGVLVLSMAGLIGGAGVGYVAETMYQIAFTSPEMISVTCANYNTVALEALNADMNTEYIQFKSKYDDTINEIDHLVLKKGHELKKKEMKNLLKSVDYIERARNILNDSWREKKYTASD
jgi:hypothetical protein